MERNHEIQEVKQRELKTKQQELKKKIAEKTKQITLEVDLVSQLQVNTPKEIAWNDKLSQKKASKQMSNVNNVKEEIIN